LPDAFEPQVRGAASRKLEAALSQMRLAAIIRKHSTCPVLKLKNDEKSAGGMWVFTSSIR
jgi:hypothetical protein